MWPARDVGRLAASCTLLLVLSGPILVPPVLYSAMAASAGVAQAHVTTHRLTHHSPLTAHHSPLTTHHSPLTTHRLTRAGTRHRTAARRLRGRLPVDVGARLALHGALRPALLLRPRRGVAGCLRDRAGRECAAVAAGRAAGMPLGHASLYTSRIFLSNMRVNPNPTPTPTPPTHYSAGGAGRLPRLCGHGGFIL